MIGVADEDSPTLRLFLEMAFQAKSGVTLGQQALVDRAMRRVAVRTSVSNGFMLENKWPALRDVTLQTGIILAEQEGASTFHGLGQAGPATLEDPAFVRIVTINAANLSFEHRVMMR